MVEVGEANFSLHKVLISRLNSNFYAQTYSSMFSVLILCFYVIFAQFRVHAWLWLINYTKLTWSLLQFMLVAKSNHIRKLVLESTEPDLTRINLSDIPGGPETFEKAAKFCYGVNFEITVQNVAALRCAAEYLEMTDKYCDNNLTGRTEDFLTQVALSSLSGAIVVLKSCEELLPVADDLKIVQRCVDVATSKVLNCASITHHHLLQFSR